MGWGVCGVVRGGLLMWVCGCCLGMVCIGWLKGVCIGLVGLVRVLDVGLVLGFVWRLGDWVGGLVVGVGVRMGVGVGVGVGFGLLVGCGVLWKV